MAEYSEYVAVVVVFHPNPTDIANLATLAADVPKLIVVDNSEPPVDLGTLPPNVIVSRPGRNLGVAGALNIGIDRAKDLGAAYIFFLDQDSALPQGYCERMVQFFKNVSLVSPIAVAAPNYRDRNSGAEARFAVFRYLWWFRVSCATHGHAGRLQVSTAITSGSMTSIAVIERLGNFRTELFIDGVDTEFCLRAKRAGMHVVVNCNERIEHSIGVRTTHNFLGIVLAPKHHSARRRYFIARNNVRLAIEYRGTLPAYANLVVAQLLHEVVMISFFESGRRSKLLALLRGIADGLRGRLGPFPFNE